jgi:hypothetical protein
MKVFDATVADAVTDIDGAARRMLRPVAAVLQGGSAARRKLRPAARQAAALLQGGCCDWRRRWYKEAR